MKEEVDGIVTEDKVTSDSSVATGVKTATPIEQKKTKEKIDEDKIITEFPPDMFDIKKKPVYDFFKRLIDIIISAIAIVVIFPFGLILAIVIVCDSPGESPIFVQKRVGKFGKKFKLYKFRTMIPGAEDMLDELEEQNEMEGNAFKMKDDPRITRVGKIIRKISVDELPQFLNVFLGNMTIVGPRPPIIKEVAKYADNEKIRLTIKPGLTCYWQTMPKRNDLTFEEWVALDVKYINERSVWTDIKIFFKTFGAIFGAEGR